MATEPIRALWRALIRFESEKIVPEIAVRNTVGFVCAVALGTIFASPSTGVVAGLGALNVAYTDGRDPYSRRARRMFISAGLSAVAVTLGAISGNNNIAAVIAAAVWSFAAGMLVALGTAATDLGVITLVTLVVFAAKPLEPLLAVQTGAVALAGGLLQTMLGTFLWPVRRYEPERRIVAALYTDLAKITESHHVAGQQPAMTAQISDAQDALEPLTRDHSVEAERHVFLLLQAERIRLSLLNLTRLYRRIARQEDGTAEAIALARVLEHAAVALRFIGQRALDHSPAANCESFEELTTALVGFQSGVPSTGAPFSAALLRDARHQADALRSQLLAACAAASGTVGNPYPDASAASEGNAAPEPWRLRFQGWRARLLANLSLESTVFRHAVRLAVCLSIGDAIGRSLELQRTYWIPMTVAIVLKPDFTGTFARGVLRIGGTLAGLVLATALFHFVHVGVVGDIALMAVFTLIVRLVGPANYGIFVIGMSGLVVLMIAVTGIAPADVIIPRALNTVLGGSLALLTYAVWPTWEKTQTRLALAGMLEAYAGYFDTVIAAYEGGPLAAIDEVRMKGRRARTNAVGSVDRMAGEPGVTTAQVTAMSAILVHSHSFVHAVMAMESRLYRSRRDAPPAWIPDFKASAETLLRTVSGMLRNPSPDAPSGKRRKFDVETAQAGQNPGGNALLEMEAGRVRTSLRSLAEEVVKRDWL